MIEHTLRNLLLLLNRVPEQIRQLGDDALNEKPNAGTWSKKEILGHLCDSAFINISRIVRGQVDDMPQIFYDQDSWVNVQNYQSYDVEPLVKLWSDLNIHFYHITHALDANALSRVCLNKSGNKLTLEFFINDYLLHLQHHLNQILTISGQEHI